MIYVLRIDDKVISTLKENRLQYKNLILSCNEGLCGYFIYAEVENKTTRLYKTPENNEIKYLCYHKEKNTSCFLELNIFGQINAIIDDYQYITIEDFSVVNHW